MQHQSVKRIVLRTGAGLIIWFLLHTVWSIIVGIIPPDESADFAVVLGNAINPDGSPHPRTAARLDRAHELFTEGGVKYVIVSGGKGKEGFEEAEVMAGYLREKGIPDDRLIIDRQGYNTRLTARHAAEIAAEQHFVSAIVVTSYFHVARSEMALRDAGFEQVQGAHARYVEWRDVYSLLREFPAFYFYLLGGRG